MLLFIVWPELTFFIIILVLLLLFNKILERKRERRHFTRDELFQIASRNRGWFGPIRCANCGSTNNLEVDHIVPLSRGGTNDIDNLRILCKSCHRKRKKK